MSEQSTVMFGNGSATLTRKISQLLRQPLWIATGLLTAYSGWLALRIGTAPGLLTTGVTLFLFALPGLFLGVALFGHRISKNPESLIFGSVMGIALSAFLALAIGYLFAWSVKLTVHGVIVLMLICAVLCWRSWKRPILASRLREWQRGDYAILLAMFAVLLGFVTVPFLNVGKWTPQGFGYTWLFGFDFLLRSAIAASVTHGLPPNYLHLAGEPLRIYLVSYAVPAFAYSASGKSVSIHSILLLTQLVTSMLFLACLYSFLRSFITDRRALWCAAMVAIAGYSYYGWYVLAKLILLKFPAASGFLRREGLAGFGEVSHLYQRLFLVEPQALTGLCVFLLVLFVLGLLQYRMTSYLVAVILGLTLGIEFGIEGWQGLILAAWFGCVFLWRWARAPRQFGPEYGPLTVAIAICAGVYVSYLALGVYAISSGEALAIRPFWWAIAVAPSYFPTEYGPMLLLGAWGLWRKSRQGRSEISVPLLILAGLTLFQIFFVTAKVLPEFGLLRGNRILPLVLLVWTGYLFEDLFRRKNTTRARVLAIALVVAALPTFLTDIHFTSNVGDQANTHYVRPADLAACNWIRRNLPEEAIVQSEPDYVGQPHPPKEHGAIELSLIADFAQRPMAVGEYWIASTIIPNSQAIAETRYQDVHRMFLATDISSVSDVVRKHNLQYLYVGPYEQQLYPNLLGLLKNAPALFSEIYSAQDVHVFKWNGARADAAYAGSRSPGVVP